MVTPPLSHRQVWSLAGPIIISNITVPIVGAVDTAVVGQLPSPEAIGAIALGALFFNFIYWSFGFLRMGTTGYIARAFGADDFSQLRLTLLRVLMLAIGFGLLTIILQTPLLAITFALLSGSTVVESLASDYISIRIYSAPAALIIYVCSGVFIGLQQTRQVLWLLLLLNATNLLLDLILVLGFAMGVHGVAIATLVAEYLAAITGLYLLRTQIREAMRAFNWRQVFAAGPYLELLKTNGNIWIRTLCLVFAFSYFTAQSARLGEVILAANAILLHYQSIMAFALDGFAHAAEALTGSAYGGRNLNAFRRAVRLTSLWSVCFASVFSIIYWLFGENLLSLFTNIEPVIATAKQYLLWICIAPMISIASYQLDGIFLGTGYSREMRNAMLISTLGYIAILHLFMPILGNHGLFLSLISLMVLRGLTLRLYYSRITIALSRQLSVSD